MRVFMLPPDFSGTRSFRLERKDSHYIGRVLRKKVGDQLSGRDRTGGMWDLIISEISREGVILSCSPARASGPTGAAASAPSAAAGIVSAVSDLPEIHLYQAICKGRKIDQIIRQATEIGVWSVTPFISRYSVAAGGSEESGEGKIRRWKTIITEALQQCGSPVLTSLHGTIDFPEMISRVSAEHVGLFFHHEPLVSNSLTATVKDVLLPSRLLSEEVPLSFAVIIGPEGGFAPEETEKMSAAGLKPVYLRTNILRAETAAGYALAVLQNLLVEMDIEEHEAGPPAIGSREGSSQPSP